MALSDFMPYGAPELLEGASPRMARSTMVASGIVALLVTCLGALLSLQPPVVERIIDLGRVDKLLPQPKVETPDEPGPVIHQATRVDAQPLVAPDPPIIERTEPAIDPATPVEGTPSGPLEHSGAVALCDVCPDRARELQPNEYVYTDELPKLLHGTKPVYPDIAREAGVEGTVKLDLLLGLDGHVRRAIVRPGGSVPMLDAAAIAAAMSSVFTPALVNQRPVMVWVTQDYRFTLH